MHQKSIFYPLAALLLALAIMLSFVQPVAAQAGEGIQITGTVISVDEEAGVFVVETEEGDQYTVFPGEDFNFTTIQEGDQVTVSGTLNEDGTVSGEEVVAGEQDGEGGPAEGYYCTQSDVPHPFGEMLSESYGTDYTTLQTYFCEGFGWGQIMLALQTSQITGGDFSELLEARAGGAGWGEIWQELKLIGRPEDAGPPNDLDGDGRPDFAGPPNDLDGDGHPDHAGPPDDLDGDGRPDFAGPPNGVGKGGRPGFAGGPPSR